MNNPAKNHLVILPPCQLVTSQRRRAFTLIEILVWVLLLAVVSVMLVQLFSLTTHATRDAQKRDTLLHRIDSAVAHLRKDAWAATKITTAADDDSSSVELPPVDGPVVTWRYTKDGKLSRTTVPPTGTQSWADLPPVAFSAHGPLLTLTLKAVNRDETETFVSQQMLAQKAQSAKTGAAK